MKTKLILVVLAVMLILSVAIAPVPVAASPAIVATNLQFDNPPVCKADEVLEWTCPSGEKFQCFDHIDLHGIPFRVCAYVGGTAGLCELQCKEYGNYDSEDDN